MKIKIVHLVPGLGFGGAERIILNLCRCRDRSRFDIDVFFWGAEDGLAAAIRATGARVVKFSFKKVVSLRSITAIARAFNDSGADILHTHLMDGDFLGFMASRMVQCPVIAHIHSYPYPLAGRHAWRYRLMSPWVYAFVCVSGAVRDHVKQVSGIGENKLKVIYNGIDLKQFSGCVEVSDRVKLKRNLGLSGDDFVVGTVSRLVAGKGHEVLLKAIAIVLTCLPEVKFLIVGDGVLREDLQKSARVLGIERAVVFSGYRPDVPALLKIMDVCVFPELFEAFGLSVVESMASARPLIASNAAAFKELVRNEKDGLLVQPGDAQGFAEAIVRLIKDPVLSGVLGSSAKERAMFFDAQAMTDNFEKVYESAGV